MNPYMKLAADLAEENVKTGVGGPFGACIVKDGEIVGKGSNHVLAHNDPTAHGEIMAIRDACQKLGSYDLSGCELYTSAYPCPMCMSASIWANIKKIYYGNTKEEAAAIGFRDDAIYDFLDSLSDEGGSDGPVILEQLDHEETIKSFRAFHAKEDRTIY